MTHSNSSRLILAVTRSVVIDLQLNLLAGLRNAALEVFGDFRDDIDEILVVQIGL